ncbi:hypothetical protein [Paenibacillus methanolicus]|uniref:Uncharacterized protein n=1 Tax=Paenibacillus methanolicus TaxID=582686 RepID=A0A5S5CFF8_9BACL|nr:hypothetical protein [Paenibacillus methanolicus]TYP78141.1 hypothetical protein BCM02_102718 [Paenibacillus methanolicus]
MERQTQWRSYAAPFMAIMLAGALLAGCGKESNPQPDGGTASNGQTGSSDSATTNEGDAANDPDGADQGETDRIVSEYEALRTKPANAADRLAFLNANLAKLPKDAADRIMRDMLAFYDKDLEPAQQRLADQRIDEQLAAIEWPITPEKLNQVTDEKAKQAIKDVWAQGYKLETTEGTIFPIVDYGLLKKYEGALSPELSAYIGLLALESDEKSASDAALVISWDQLAERALAYEVYSKQYPDAPETSQVKQLYHNYLSMYLYGLNNTPAYDFETFKLADEVKASYEKTAAEHPDTKTGEIVKGFLAVLEQHDWQVFVNKNGEQADVPEVKAYREKVLAEL